MNNKQSRLFPAFFFYSFGRCFYDCRVLFIMKPHVLPSYMSAAQIPPWDVAHGVNMLITVTSQQALINNAFRWTQALTVSAVDNFVEAVMQHQFPSRLRAVTSLTPLAVMLRNWFWLMLTCCSASSSSSCLDLPCLLTPLPWCLPAVQSSSLCVRPTLCK